MTIEYLKCKCISRHKFRVPTRHTLEYFEISIFLTLTPLEGTLGNIFDSKIAFSIFYCHRELNKTLSKNIFNKKGGMTQLTRSLCMSYVAELFTQTVLSLAELSPSLFPSIIPH